MLQSQNPYSPERIDALTQTLSTMDPRARQQYAAQHKDDPAVVAVALNVNNILRAAENSKAMQAGGQQQPKVVDQEIAGMAPPPQRMAPPPQHMARLPEQQGIAQLQAPNLEGMADGGIAGYADGGNNMAAGGGPASQLVFNNEPVMRMAEGGVPGYAGGVDIKDYADRIRAEAVRQGVDPDLAVRMFAQESRGNPNAVSPKGAAGLGQLMIPAAKEMGLKPSERFDPEKNIPASVGYLKKQLVKYEGDPEKALAAYNWGAGNVDKHLAKNEGRLNKVGLPKETADYLTKILPIGSARAEDVPQPNKPAAPAAAPAPAPAPVAGLTDKEAEALSRPAFVTPSSGKGRKEGKLSEVIKSGEAPRQMLLGASDLPYNIAGAPVDIATAAMRPFGYKNQEPALGSEHLKRLGTQYLGREAETTDPTLRKFRTAGELGSMAVDPFAATRKVAQTAEGLEALAAAQRAKVAEAEAKVQTPVGMRLEPPRTEPPVMVADSQGRIMPADTRARVEQAMADEAAVGTEAAKAAELEKQAAAYPGAAQRAEMLKTAETADQARGAAAAAKVGDAATMQKLGITTAPNPLLNLPPVREDEFGTTPEDKKATIDAVKEAVPAKDRKGFDNDDLLTLGLNLMANKSRNLMTAVGESGLQTLAAKREREKGETEKMYRDALIEQAKRPAAEMQLLERYQKDPEFAAAYERFASAKREPMTRETLLKSWGASPYLQMTYQNPEDYIKMMSSAASGGASGSQLSAADQSLVQKYLR